MTVPLSDDIKQLIRQARIVSFSAWANQYPQSVLNRLQACDDQGVYLSDDDLIAIATHNPEAQPNTAIAQQLRDQAKEIVDEARTIVLRTFPQITEPGGGLYPTERASACWRDFWQFLRCITYGIAGKNIHYTSPAGLQAMEKLYQALQVPLDAMVVGLEGLKTASLKRVEANQHDHLAPYFDHLIQQLQQFQNAEV